MKRNRFVQLVGGTRILNRDLETKARTLAGWKPYVTNLLDVDATFVISSYHQLWHVEHSFRIGPFPVWWRVGRVSRVPGMGRNLVMGSTRRSFTDEYTWSIHGGRVELAVGGLSGCGRVL